LSASSAKAAIKKGEFTDGLKTAPFKPGLVRACLETKLTHDRAFE